MISEDEFKEFRLTKALIIGTAVMAIIICLVLIIFGTLSGCQCNQSIISQDYVPTDSTISNWIITADDNLSKYKEDNINTTDTMQQMIDVTMDEANVIIADKPVTKSKLSDMIWTDISDDSKLDSAKYVGVVSIGISKYSVTNDSASGKSLENNKQSKLTFLIIIISVLFFIMVIVHLIRSHRKE